MTEIATLSLEGWVKSPSSKLDTLFADFLAAAYSQYPFAETDVSMTWLLAKYLNKPRELEEAIENVLSLYISKHFPQSTVEVKAMVKDIENSSRQSLHISALVKDDQVSHQLNESVLVEGNRVISFAKANNQNLLYRG